MSSEHFSVSIFFSYKSTLPAYLSLKDRNHDVGWHDKWLPPLSYKPLQSLIVILRRQFLPHPLPELTQSCSVSSQSTFSLVIRSQIMFALLCSSSMLRFFLLQDFHISCSLSLPTLPTESQVALYCLVNSVVKNSNNGFSFSMFIIHA